MSFRKTLFLIVLCCAPLTAKAQPPTAAQINLTRQKAFELIARQKYLDALPLLEKVAESNPKDAEFWAEYSLAVFARALTLDAAEARRRERIAARALAVKALEMGSKNERVVEIAEKIPADGGDFDEGNSELQKLFTEAEKHFQRGEYDQAFVFFERAHKLDPQNYFAALYAGDCFYAKKEYAKAEPWFAKAVAIDPDREAAYRFWGDALMLQNQPEKARDKFIEAVIAEPFLRVTWDRLQRWADESGNGWHPTAVTPPGGKPFGEIEFDEKLLKAEDGTKNWLRYDSMRLLWRQQVFKKEFPAEREYRQTLRETAAALRLVAETSKRDLERGNVKTLDESLKNLIKISDADLLEAYVLFPRVNGDIAADYEEYRRANRAKLRRFLLEFIIGEPEKKKNDA